MKRSMIAAAALAALAAPLLPLSASAQESGRYSIGTGLFYSTGTYGGTQSTNIVYLPVTAKYRGEEWTLKLTVPYIQITGPGNVLNGVGATGVTNPAAVATHSGMGDVVTSASHRVYHDGAAGLTADLTGKVKFGTADSAKGLGTGKNDYALQADGFKTRGRLTVMATAGYKVYGSPAAYTLNNVFFGSAGFNFQSSAATDAGATWSVRQKALATGYTHREALVYANWKFDRAWKTQGYVLKGFSKGSPDWGAGAFVYYLF